jgi:hypothetical protein
MYETKDRAAIYEAERVVADVLDEWSQDIPYMSSIALAERVVAALVAQSCLGLYRGDEAAVPVHQ